MHRLSGDLCSACEPSENTLAAPAGAEHGELMSKVKVAAVNPALLARDVGIGTLRDELSRARSLCRAWSGTVPEARRGDMAGLFTRKALEAFGTRVHPQLTFSPPLDRPFGKLDRAAAELARAVGEDAASLPLAEGLYFVTSLYPAMLPEKVRGQLGAFYTPPCLVQRLVDLSAETGINWATARVLDPAAGAGAFLVEAAIRMRGELGDAEPGIMLRSISTRLRGFELDPIAAGLAQAALEIALHDLCCAARLPLPQIVNVCDALAEEVESAFDLVIGNPPYGRVSLRPEQRARFGRSLYGHANLYGLFTDAALRWTKNGGMVAFLTPTSFLAGHYYTALRRLLAEEAPPVAIDFVNARRGVFEDVLQETLLAVYARGGQRTRAQVHYLHVRSEREADVVRNGTIGLPTDPGAPWLAPRSPEHSDLIARAESMISRLSDYGYAVSTGPLVWNRHKSQLCGAPAGRGVHPLVWAECVTPDGRFVFRALKRNHAPYFDVKPGDEWLRVDTPCVLVQRTTAKEQARRLIAAELPEAFVREHGGVVVENHLNMVRAIGKPRVAPRVLAALLNSFVVDQVFRCMSGSVAVSAFELEAMPLPAVEDLKTLTKLVNNGADAKTIATECDQLYGRSTK